MNTQYYQDIDNLTAKVMSYINALAGWSGTQRWAGVNINPGDVLRKELLLALPPNITSDQLAALQRLQQTAWETYEIVLTLVTVK